LSKKSLERKKEKKKGIEKERIMRRRDRRRRKKWLTMKLGPHDSLWQFFTSVIHKAVVA